MFDNDLIEMFDSMKKVNIELLLNFFDYGDLLDRLTKYILYYLLQGDVVSLRYKDKELLIYVNTLSDYKSYNSKIVCNFYDYKNKRNNRKFILRDITIPIEKSFEVEEDLRKLKKSLESTKILIELFMNRGDKNEIDL